MLSSLLPGVVAAVVVAFLARRRIAAVAAGTLANRESAILFGTCLAVPAVWALDAWGRDRLPGLADEAAWWRFALVPIVAALCLMVLARRLPVPRRATGTAAPRRLRRPRRASIVLVAVVGVVAAVMVAWVLLPQTRNPSGAMLLTEIASSTPRIETVTTGWTPGWPPTVLALAALALLLLAVRGVVVRAELDAPDAVDPAPAPWAHAGVVASSAIVIGLSAGLISLASVLRVTASAGIPAIRLVVDGREQSVDTAAWYEGVLRAGASVAPILEIAAVAASTVLALGLAYTVRATQTPAPR